MMQTPAFQLLHPRVQQVMSDLGWGGLYPVQEEAIRCFAANGFDLIVSAPNSGGKTEAVFLPILSELVGKPATTVQVLCISPLKALINDQYGRLLTMCQPLGIGVHRWHGDVDVEAKRRLREHPSGILFIDRKSTR